MASAACLEEIGLDPRCWCYVKLSICHIQQTVQQLPGFRHSHTLFNRVITKVHVVGCIVSKAVKSNRSNTLKKAVYCGVKLLYSIVEYVVDDGTGLIQATHWQNQRNNLNEQRIQLGDVVSVHGKLQYNLSLSSAVREIHIVFISTLTDPNMEILHWLEVKDLMSTNYQLDLHLGGPSSTLSSNPMEPLQLFLQQAFFLDDDIQFCSEKFYFEGELIKYLCHLQKGSTNALQFSFHELLAVDKLLEAANIVLHRTLLSPDNYDITMLYRKSLKLLCNNGIISLIDEETSLYWFVSFDKVVKPKIILHLSGHEEGQNLYEIADFVITNNGLEKVSLSWVRRSLVELCKRNIIKEIYVGIFILQ